MPATSTTSIYVRVPPRPPTGVPAADTWTLGPVGFAVVREHATPTVLRQGFALPDDLPEADRIILIFSASEVWMAQVSVPPLTQTKLRQALPHLVEDRLVGDAQRCHLATQAIRGRNLTAPQTVAAIDRAWFRYVLTMFSTHTHRRLHALAAQQCLPNAIVSGREAAAVIAIETAPVAEGLLADLAPQTFDITVCPTARPGFGVRLDANSLPVWLATMVGETRLLAPADLQSNLAASTGRTIDPLAWPTWLAGARAALAAPETVDLCQFEFAGEAGSARLWQAWRLPAALAAGVLLVHLIGINTHWLMLHAQKSTLVTQMEQTLRNAFPHTSVIVDAPLQMRRQLEQLRLANGKTGPADFLPLADRFSQAATTLPPDGLQALDYRDQRLHITLKAGLDATPLRERVRTLGLQMMPVEAVGASGSAPDSSASAAANIGNRWIVTLANGAQS